MKWIVAAFDHPNNTRSVYYRQNVKDLLKAVREAVQRGANLISIRGFKEPGDVAASLDQIVYKKYRQLWPTDDTSPMQIIYKESPIEIVSRRD